MLESLVRKIVSIDGVNGCIAVNQQDGSIMFKEGNISPALEDITAFFGSGFDVVASSLDIKGLKFSYLQQQNQKIIIIVRENGYIGCEIGKNASFEEVIENIVKSEKSQVTEKEEAKEEEKISETAESELSQEERFLRSKLKQINLLIDEFSEGKEKEKWVEIVRQKFLENVAGKAIENVIQYEESTVKFTGVIDPNVKEEEIAGVTKLVTDSLCRKAVEVHGAIEAKKKVHNVIEKLGIGR